MSGISLGAAGSAAIHHHVRAHLPCDRVCLAALCDDRAGNKRTENRLGAAQSRAEQHSARYHGTYHHVTIMPFLAKAYIILSTPSSSSSSGDRGCNLLHLQPVCVERQEGAAAHPRAGMGLARHTGAPLPLHPMQRVVCGCLAWASRSLRSPISDA